MKVAYLILAHKNPSQLQNLISALEDENVCFYIHIDKKSTEDFQPIKSGVSPITFIERISVTWGGWTVVEATLALLRAALEHKFDRLHLLSGQDYPTTSRAAIAKAFDNDINYIDYFPLPDDRLGGLWRVERFHFIEGLSRFPEGIRNVMNYILEIASKLYKRKPPTGFSLHGGSTWWSITGACAEVIIKCCDERPDLIRFFRYTKCPDETFFQTIILSSPISKKTSARNMRYIAWQGGSHPTTLTIDFLEQIRAAHCHFARKFEPGVSDALVEKLNSINN